MPKQYVPPFAGEALDLTDVDDASEPIEVGRWDLIRFQPRAASGSWGTAEVVVEFSVDGVTYGDLPEIGEIRFTAPGISKAYYIPAVKRMRFRVDVDDAAAGTAEVPCVVDCTRLEEVVQATGSFS